MSHLGISRSELEAKGAIHTAREIAQQPELWAKIAAALVLQQKSISDFISASKPARIILTGAGTSAFIGLSLRGIFQNQFGIVTDAISTTDIVSHPHDYLLRKEPTLLVSFARSGNSPESAAAVALADTICDACAHLIITCNPEGLLARQAVKGGKYVIVLPAEANDQSLAMTSSYTGMLLAGKLVAHCNALNVVLPQVDLLCKYAEKSVQYYAAELQQLANVNFKRAVFLGSGPFYGTATEAHLKLQELTDGQVICKNDSFLGFRHGPKAVVDSTTLVAYIFSNNQHALKYERDLVRTMHKGSTPLLEIGVGESKLPDIALDHVFTYSENGPAVDEGFLAVSSIVPFQMLAFYKSLQLGLKPDTPSATGAITRVVEGVNIYSIL
ncbi:MAG: SIS domain-containing protein [Cytophagales bacterium]|nr:SIS domain-containing protein [Cytophagales bacterium]